MKAIAIILVCLTLAGTGFAQSPGDSQPLAAGTFPPVSVSFSNVPLKQAIESLFNDVGAGFVLDPGVSQSPFDRISVSLKLVNADFEQALSTLLDRTGLAWTREETGYRIAPSTAPTPAFVLQMQAVQNLDQAADLATMNLAAMPVKDALTAVWPQSPWTFKDDLGHTTMPGAKFYRFPRPIAGATVIAAAGLIPPTGDATFISARGQADLKPWFQWDPGNQMKQQAGTSMSPAAGNARFGANQQNIGNAICPNRDVAISAYRSRVGDTWVFTVLANRALDIDVLEKLFALSGKAYVMGDLTQRPQVINQSYDSQPGEEKMVRDSQQEQLVIRIRGPKQISAQLRNVTLDQALDTLLPAAGLMYRKIGPPNNLTYIIEAPPLIPQ